MIRRPPRSTLDRSSAASDVYKRQEVYYTNCPLVSASNVDQELGWTKEEFKKIGVNYLYLRAVSYTHLRAHETVLDLVCRLLLETKN